MKALIAMSGGVDSSAAAALMLERQYECVGVTMKLFRNEDVDISRDHTCCSLEDVEDARSVACSLGIPYYVFNFTADFSQQVIRRFIDAYERGETPNPCIDCNRYMKFEKLYQRAAELGCDVIVTGHYARTCYDPERKRWLLLRGKNRDKDQSYVLYFMSQEQLAHTVFPLGECESKDQVRQIAERYGMDNARKHDSQDICFVVDGDYGDFIEKYTGKTWPQGDFIDREGRVLGRHRGIIRYTIGQRKGLGLALPAPLYVCRKDMKGNRVILAPEKALYARSLTAGSFNWIPFDRPEGELRVTARPRYRAKEAPALVRQLEDGRVSIVFDEPQRAITAGQAVVLYDGDMVVGGGTILSVEQEEC